jgi:hypothetical protein
MAVTVQHRRTPAPPGDPRRRRLATAVAVVAAATALVWAASLASAWLLARGTRGPTVHELVIEPGTARRVAAGENPLALAPSLDFVVGDTLRLVNRDAVAHVLGGWRVEAHSARSIRFRSPTGGTLACSVHPSGRLGIEVRSRGVDLAATAVPAAVFGPLLGGAVLGVVAVVRRLGPD